MFMYSERPGTPAAKKYKDDVPEEVKASRLQEVITLMREHSHKRNMDNVGKTYKVLIEGYSKRSEDMMRGRNEQNKMLIFPSGDFKKGDYVNVLVTDCTSGTLLGKIAN